jgi:hypothetical protein
MQAPDEFAGKRVKCKGCGTSISVPEAATGEDAFSQMTADQPKASPVRANEPANASGQERRSPTPRQTKSSSSKVLLIVLAVVGVLGLCCACPVGLGMMFYMRVGEAKDKFISEMEAESRGRTMAERVPDDGPDRPSLTNMDSTEFQRLLGREHHFLPDGFIDLHVRRMDVLRKSPAHKRFDRAAGTSPEFNLDISNAVGDVLPLPGDLVRQITTLTQLRIYTFARPVIEKDIVALGGGEKLPKIQIGNRSAWRDAGDFQETLWVSDGNSLVVGPEKMIRDILTRNGPPKVRTEMAAALRAADFGQPDVQLAIEEDDLRGNGALEPRAAFDIHRRYPQAFVLESDWNWPINITGRAVCKDAASATKALQEFNAKPASDHPGVTATRNGNSVVFRSTRK